MLSYSFPIHLNHCYHKVCDARRLLQMLFYTINSSTEETGLRKPFGDRTGKSARNSSKLQKQQPNQTQPHAIHQIQQSLVSQSSES